MVGITSTNALGRTTHAIVSFCLVEEDPEDSEEETSGDEELPTLVPSKHKEVFEYLKGFLTRRKGDGSEEYDFFKDLQVLLKQFNRSQPNLVENAQVVVKGPGPGAVATLVL